MFKKGDGPGGFNGFLDAGSHMQGELNFEHEFRIAGKFSGSIVSDGDLIVIEGGEVDAEIRVRRVYVSGEVRGRLGAAERVEISSTGRVKADLETPSLTIEDGAFFEGHCSMERPKHSRSAAGDKVAHMPGVKER